MKADRRISPARFLLRGAGRIENTDRIQTRTGPTEEGDYHLPLRCRVAEVDRTAATAIDWRIPFVR